MLHWRRTKSLKVVSLIFFWWMLTYISWKLFALRTFMSLNIRVIGLNFEDRVVFCNLVTIRLYACHKWEFIGGVFPLSVESDSLCMTWDDRGQFKLPFTNKWYPTLGNSRGLFSSSKKHLMECSSPWNLIQITWPPTTVSSSLPFLLLLFHCLLAAKYIYHGNSSVLCVMSRSLLFLVEARPLFLLSSLDLVLTCWVHALAASLTRWLWK